MTPPAGRGCPAFLRGYPGAVLEVSPEGVVLDSNGRLERDLDRVLVGRPFLEVLDRASSQRKWERILEAPESAATAVWELILREHGTLSEPRAFSVLRDPDSRAVWLVEHPRDPRLGMLHEEVTAVNSELAGAQRELSKERSRLAQALTELETRQQELERRNSELDQFAHIASHDLKSPLRGIANYARWLEQDLEERLTDEAREYLRLLLRRVGQMEGLIDGMLRYARAGRGGAPPEPVDVAELLSEVLELLHPPAGFRVEAEPGLPTLVTQRLQLEQVFLNLIGNAIKYGHRRDVPPRVRVAAADAGDFYEFQVADNGPGIPERLRERIWTLFFTGRPGHDAEGTGIGLAVVKKLVEEQGGQVRVESGTEGGASFFFLWPKAPRAEL